MINLKGGAGGWQSDAAKHDGFRRTEEVLQDSGSVRVCLCDEGIVGEEIACVCACVRACVCVCVCFPVSWR